MQGFSGSSRNNEYSMGAQPAKSFEEACAKLINILESKLLKKIKKKKLIK